MPSRSGLPLLVALAMITTACSRVPKPPDAPPAAAPRGDRPLPPVDAPVVTAAPPAPTGRIEGVVRYVGSAPLRVKQLTNNIDVATCGERIVLQTVLLGREGAVANVFVELRREDDSPVMPHAAADTSTLGVAIRHCAIEPHVLVVPAGASLEIRNEDGLLHYLVAPALRNEPFEARLPRYRKRLRLADSALRRPEIISVSCDIHPWEVGWWIVTDNPLRALTGPDGRFVLEGVPAGTWRLLAWHEDLHRVEINVTVADGESVGAELQYR